MLDALSTGSFQLLATESGVAATEASWERPGLEPENGILFLTDQRLIWEDRVETFEVKLEQPLQEIRRSQEGVGRSYRARVPGLWPGHQRSISICAICPGPAGGRCLAENGRPGAAGDYATDRAVEIDPAELERIRNAPKQCSNCGAGLTEPILRGQREITCEYCGQVTRI